MFRTTPYPGIPSMYMVFKVEARSAAPLLQSINNFCFIVGFRYLIYGYNFERTLKHKLMKFNEIFSHLLLSIMRKRKKVKIYIKCVIIC